MDAAENHLFNVVMIHHTMIVSFEDSIADSDLNEYLKDVENLMMGSGHVQTFSAKRHIRVPGDDHAPVFISTAVVQLGLTDIDALNATFAMPEAVELIRRWQSRYPYKVVWVNHEPLT
ncbi:hypothetical protein SAZ11_50210 [Streptomyces sp. FXJ1.4098]|uniref:hypothetical protein n=1 Tax=Streptomyces sp. NPDC020845 TaxID=3365096 RepID=UPI0029992CB9|nr:hypothetical protein [Streptomyces sp. FXJ1.4098]